MSIYDFTVNNIRGEEISLESFKGKLILIVNTASKCGFTHQLEDLQTLYEKYNENGLVILGFPCNQFANQEPESNEKIQEFCRLNYGVTFPIFEKIEVNGENAIDLYKFLVSQQEFKGFNFNHPLGKKLDEILSQENPDYALNNDIKWNFTKFLINKNGECIERFEPTTDIEEIEDYIKPLL